MLVAKAWSSWGDMESRPCCEKVMVGAKEAKFRRIANCELVLITASITARLLLEVHNATLCPWGITLSARKPFMFP